MVENNYASLVGKVEEFTGALNKAWEMQQASVQQTLGMVTETDEAIGRITRLEKQLQEAERRWEKPLMEQQRMERMEKLMLNDAERFTQQDQQIQQIQEGMKQWAIWQEEWQMQIGRVEKMVESQRNDFTWGSIINNNTGMQCRSIRRTGL